MSLKVEYDALLQERGSEWVMCLCKIASLCNTARQKHPNEVGWDLLAPN